MSELEAQCCGHVFATEAEVECERLRRDRDDLADTLRRVVANESNHYDRYWTPASGPLTTEWLAETKAKMRAALEDAFCDDAAAVMLTLIAEIERLRDDNEALRADVNDYADELNCHGRAWTDADPGQDYPELSAKMRTAAKFCLSHAHRLRALIVQEDQKEHSGRSYFDVVRSITSDPDVLAAVDKAAAEEERGNE